MGGAIQGFTVTGSSLVAAVRDCDVEVRHRALGRLVRIYWKPVYKYLRIRWSVSRTSAEAWTQEFFTTVLEDDCLRSHESEFAAFRSYIRSCVDAFAHAHLKTANEAESSAMTSVFSLNFERAEAEISSPPSDGWRITRLPGEELDSCSSGEDADEFFHRECLRALFHDAVDAFERQCVTGGEPEMFEVFERFELDPPIQRPTYATLAIEMGLKPTQVVDLLRSARHEFRELALAQLAGICATEDEFEREASSLLGTACSSPDDEVIQKFNAYLLALPLLSFFIV